MTDWKSYVIGFGIVATFVCTIITFSPPGIRCSMVDNETKCVSIHLF